MKKLLTFTAVIGILVLGFYFYFHYIGRVRPSVNEIFVESADIPAPFEGARVVQISDLFVRSETCLLLLENVVETVNSLDPEIIVFTGNLFSADGVIFADSVGNLLSELEASLAYIAVLGYHDLINEEVTEYVLTNADFTILQNNSIQIFNQSHIGINIIGAHPENDHQATERLLQAHLHEERFNLLLANNPTFSTVSLNYAVQMQLSGYCLGAQDATSQTAPCFQFYNGTYQFADHLTLHVSSGLARFHSFNGFMRQPSIDSFLLSTPRVELLSTPRGEYLMSNDEYEELYE